MCKKERKKTLHSLGNVVLQYMIRWIENERTRLCCATVHQGIRLRRFSWIGRLTPPWDGRGCQSAPLTPPLTSSRRGGLGARGPTARSLTLPQGHGRGARGSSHLVAFLCFDPLTCCLPVGLGARSCRSWTKWRSGSRRWRPIGRLALPPKVRSLLLYCGDHGTSVGFVEPVVAVLGWLLAWIELTM